MYKRGIKRIFDFVFALLIVLFVWPLLIVIAVIIKIDSKGPVVFKQKRLGLHGKEFWIYKYRTMIVNAEAGGVYSNNKDPRVTRFGKILRKTSLDELMQLFNILKGDMSFIGPRPPLTYHPWNLCEYTEHQKRMFEVRPGVTGWAQINGRREVEWNKRIELNVWYVQNISLWLDIKVFLQTIVKVLKNENNENTKETAVK